MQFQNVNGNYFELYPGAVENGVVNLGSGKGNFIALGSGSETGVISGLGTQFTGFSTLSISQGASWVLQGSVPLGGVPGHNGAVENSGTITGSGNGVYITGGGTVGNDRYGFISGASYGVLAAAGRAAVINGGTIIGGAYDAVYLEFGRFSSQQLRADLGCKLRRRRWCRGRGVQQRYR